MAKVDAYVLTKEDLGEAPELTPEKLTRATPKIAGRTVTWEEFRAEGKRRGRPAIDNPKMAVKLRLDADVVEHFRATGPGWQTRINEALRRVAKLPASPAKTGAAAAKRSPKKTRRP